MPRFTLPRLMAFSLFGFGAATKYMWSSVHNEYKQNLAELQKKGTLESWDELVEFTEKQTGVPIDAIKTAAQAARELKVEPTVFGPEVNLQAQQGKFDSCIGLLTTECDDAHAGLGGHSHFSVACLRDKKTSLSITTDMYPTFLLSGKASADCIVATNCQNSHVMAIPLTSETAEAVIKAAITYQHYVDKGNITYHPLPFSLPRLDGDKHTQSNCSSAVSAVLKPVLTRHWGFSTPNRLASKIIQQTDAVLIQPELAQRAIAGEDKVNVPETVQSDEQKSQAIVLPSHTVETVMTPIARLSQHATDHLEAMHDLDTAGKMQYIQSVIQFKRNTPAT